MLAGNKIEFQIFCSDFRQAATNPLSFNSETNKKHFFLFAPGQFV